MTAEKQRQVNMTIVNTIHHVVANYRINEIDRAEHYAYKLMGQLEMAAAIGAEVVPTESGLMEIIIGE